MKTSLGTARFIEVLAIASTLNGCVRGERSGATSSQEGTRMSIVVTSPQFTHGAAIPARHTCDAEDISPALHWTGLPPAARSLALVCDDPDAPVGTWVHWVLYGLRPSVDGLSENVAKADTTLEGARQGLNDFKRVGYGGPCPPPGKPHRYFFRLYVLDAPIALEPRATKKDLLRAMEGHVLAQGELMGTYGRK